MKAVTVLCCCCFLGFISGCSSEENQARNDRINRSPLYPAVPGNNPQPLENTPQEIDLTKLDTFLPGRINNDLLQVLAEKNLFHKLLIATNESGDPAESDADLRVLDLSLSKVTDEGLTHLAGLTNLTMLSVSDLKITDAGLAHLKPLVNLEDLNLAGTEITDDGLVHLQALTSLNILDLSHCSISGKGLQHLKPLKKLTSLDLANTGIEDSGVMNLTDLNSLLILDLSETQVTKEGKDRLREALPEGLILK